MDALYFPHLSLPSSTWVNPALLYFDRVGVIAPEGDHRSLFDHRTQELLDLGMARAVIPRGEWGREQDRDFISFLLGIASSKRSYGRIERVHAGKLMYTPIADALESAGLLSRVDHGWLEGPDWAVGRVMAYLALQISSHEPRPLPLVTNERAAARVMSDQEGKTASRRVRAVARLLPAPSDALPREIDQFRRAHHRELEAFRGYIDALITRDQMDDDGETSFEERLREAERVRDHLVGEMQAFDWRSQGPGFAIAALGAVAPLMEQSPWSFGVGLLSLVYGGAQGAAALGRRRAARASPLVYSTQVVGRWQPNAQQALR